MLRTVLLRTRQKGGDWSWVSQGFKDFIGNWARGWSCGILAKNLGVFNPYSENLHKAKLKQHTDFSGRTKVNKA